MMMYRCPKCKTEFKTNEYGGSFLDCENKCFEGLNKDKCVWCVEDKSRPDVEDASTLCFEHYHYENNYRNREVGHATSRQVDIFCKIKELVEELEESKKEHGERVKELNVFDKQEHFTKKYSDQNDK